MSERPRCRKTGRIIFRSSGEAAQEIEQAQRLRADGVVSGRLSQQGKVEKRSWPCVACGGHHLTSEDAPETQENKKPRRQRGR